MKAGGFPAAVTQDVHAESVLPGTVLEVVVSALMGVGWSFKALRSGDTLSLASRAIGEAYAVVSHQQGARPKAASKLMGPTALRLILAVFERVVPLDLETYFRVHFTKVGQQMAQGRRWLVDQAEKAGLPHQALSELHARAGTAN
jgi:2-dehydropantoate 2-reductase